MKLLDTNIVMYAVGKPHVYKAPCQAILQKALNNTEVFNIDAELCQELLYVYGRRGEMETGFKTVDALLRLFPNLFVIDSDVILETTRLMHKYPKLVARDAIHAAVSIAYDLEGIISVDKVFEGIKGLKRFKIS